MILNQIPALQQIGFPVLSVLLLLPLVAAIVLRMARDDASAYSIALVASIAELALALFVWQRFVPEVADVQFVEHIPLIASIGFGYHVGVDGISVLFLPATALLALLAVLYVEPSVRSNSASYLSALLMFEATMIGAFISLDMLFFLFFFVAELYPSWILITRWGTGERRAEAALTYVTMMLIGAMAMLIGIVMLALNYGNVAAAGMSFNYLKLLSVDVPHNMQALVFFLLCLGFCIKAPIFPLHTWMPKVLEQGPIVGMSIFLVGIKLGTYGILRFAIPLVPEAAKEWFWLMALLGVLGMVYGALIALVQTNLRRLLAFASLSHMGVVMLGLFSLNFTGMQGGLLQMINLGITGAGLFFIAAFLFQRVGPPELARMGGLNELAPFLAMAFLVIGLAGVGMPGTSGFNGEHLVMLGAFKMNPWMAGAAGLGTLLSASYFLWYYQQAFLGSARAGTPRVVVDLGHRERWIAGTLATLVIAMGMVTGPFLNTMSGSLKAIEERVHKGSPKAAHAPAAVAASLAAATVAPALAAK